MGKNIVQLELLTGLRYVLLGLNNNNIEAAKALLMDLITELEERRKREDTVAIKNG